MPSTSTRATSWAAGRFTCSAGRTSPSKRGNSCSVSAGVGARARLRQKARELLARLGLGERLRHRPSQLSGGEQQRVAIARALINDPPILLCDEPTGNLDEKTSEGIIDTLTDLNRQAGQTTIMVTHNRELAGRADRVVHLTDGHIEPMETPGTG